MKVQFQEETEHGMKLFDYVADRAAGSPSKPSPSLKPTSARPRISSRRCSSTSAKVTASIHKLYELALAEKDYATQAHLQWFITEQVEEEKNAEGILRQIQAMEGKAHLMLSSIGTWAPARRTDLCKASGDVDPRFGCACVCAHPFAVRVLRVQSLRA
jgi:ferritin